MLYRKNSNYQNFVEKLEILWYNYPEFKWFYIANLHEQKVLNHVM